MDDRELYRHLMDIKTILEQQTKALEALVNALLETPAEPAETTPKEAPKGVKLQERERR